MLICLVVFTGMDLPVLETQFQLLLLNIFRQCSLVSDTINAVAGLLIAATAVESIEGRSTPPLPST